MTKVASLIRELAALGVSADVLSVAQRNATQRDAETELSHFREKNAARSRSYRVRRKQAQGVKRHVADRDGAIDISSSSFLSASQGIQEKERFSESQSSEPRASSDVSRAISDDWPADYEAQFWAQYPRKVGRKAARAKLRIIRKSGEVTFGRLMAGVAKISADEARFIPHPTTWLNRGGWDDEPTPPKQNGGPNGHKPAVGARQSGGADFFAGLETVAANISRDRPVGGPAAEEIPLGRHNIDG